MPTSRTPRGKSSDNDRPRETTPRPFHPASAAPSTSPPGATLIVYGTNDDHFSDPTIEGESLARRLGGEFLMVEGAGHYLHIEQRELFNERLIRFLAEAGVA